jgi:tetratricopeptide (TPR) repeat protein
VDSIEHAVSHAGGGLTWALSERQQDLVLRVGPAPFNHDTSTWGGAVGSIYLTRGDSARARVYFQLALTAQERLVADEPSHVDQQQHLGRLLALLGRRQEAIRRGEQAMALARERGSVLVMEYVRAGLAAIYVDTDEHGAALAQIDTLLRGPSRFNPGRLREEDDYAALRGDPRFERLLAAHEVMAPASPAD